MHVRKRLDGPEEIIGRYMDIKGNSGELWDGNMEYVTGKRRKGNRCYKVAKKLKKSVEL